MDFPVSLLSGFGGCGKAGHYHLYLFVEVFVVWWIIKFIIDMVHKNQTGGAPVSGRPLCCKARFCRSYSLISCLMNYVKLTAFVQAW